ncbi:PREDICTED: odorant receptor 82a-like [Ceratosolen solmsi marchali]|uniref:Odorant receptor n=1 Tax=Ceratosolen solmsi marchali TaxID=326594 RepID=A0AAJ6VK07_9HYME|nr:PREDICTED: odorant receptor 82a-like [Ceratosolen solmsi marchali]
MKDIDDLWCDMKRKRSKLSFESVNKINILLMKIAGLLAFESRSINSIGTTTIIIYAHFSIVFIICMYISTALMNAYRRIMNFERSNIATLLVESEKLWGKLQEAEKPIISCLFLTKHLRGFVRTIGTISICYLGFNFSWSAMCITITQFHGTTNDTSAAVRRELPYSFALDLQDSPSYEIMFIVQIITSFGYTLVVAGFDMAPPYFIMTAAAHFKMLCSRFEEMQKQDRLRRADEAIEDVITCIAYHQMIDRFCKDISKITESFFMVQLLSSTYNLSILLYAIITDNQNNFQLLPVVGLQTLQLFSCHWISEILRSESKRLIKSTFIVPSMFERNMKLSKIIQIVILKSQNPVQLRAGGYINLSLECFGEL